MNRRRWLLAGVLLLLLAGGGTLRLVRLDFPTMGGDVMEFYKIAQAGVPPGELLVHSPKYIGAMPPLWFAVHNGFLQSFRLEVNFRNARLPDALTGILTILAAFGAGRALGGRRIGLLAALFVTLQPLHVQMSRECYFYVPIVLGGFLSLWALARLTDRIAAGQSPGTGFYMLAFAGFILSVHVQISSWSFALVWLAACYILLIRAALGRQFKWRLVAALTAGFFLAGLPALLSEWGLNDVLTLMFGASKDHWGTVFGEQKRNLLITAGHILSAYLAGRGGLRTLASLFLLAAGAAAMARTWKQERKMRIFGGVALGAFALLAAMHSKSIFPAENRHYSSLLPILTLWSCLGLAGVSDWLLAKHPRSARWKSALAWVAPAAFVVATNAWPAWLSSKVDAPLPYRQVSLWIDQHLPARTLILCDRWFTSWNEFRMNPATNAIYTFTVPSEPIQTYTESRWRDTAKTFLNNNPRAAYFEQKVYWTRIGPWTWPHGQFARKVEFADQAALRLDTMGLYYRAWALDFPREWIPVTLYYNTEEDLVARARQAGQSLLCLFGPGWEYTKTQDYRDWYALRESATAVVHNLTDAPAQVFLDIAAVATPGAITLTAYAGTNAVFPANQIQTRRLGPIEVAPGRQEIRLANLTRAEPPATLLVQQISAADR